MKKISKQKKSKTVAEKIRAFRDEFTKNYLKKHKAINMANFTVEFLNKA